ncbi:MAG: N4-gp56 family major capsid protein [Actinomycetota bacterium]
MAVLRKADVSSQIATVWSSDLFAQAESMTWWSAWEGPPGSTMPVIRKDDLMKGAGDTVKIDIVLALTGTGLTGDVVATEGNEEKLKLRQMSVPVDKVSHAVRWTELSQVLITHDLRVTAQNQLAKWLAGKLDTDIFNEMSGNGTSVIPTLNKWFSGTATTRNTIADSNAGGRLTLATMTELKAYAQTELKIEPLRLENGEEMFGLIAHPYAIMQLKRDDTSWAQAQRDARERGLTNPLFTGAVGMWDGIAIYSSQRVPRSLNVGTPIQVADNIFFGAQAVSRAYAQYPTWVEEFFSYGEEIGIATRVVKGERVNIFDLTAAGGAADADKTAIGLVVVYSAAVAPAA